MFRPYLIEMKIFIVTITSKPSSKNRLAENFGTLDCRRKQESKLLLANSPGGFKLCRRLKNSLTENMF